MATPIRLTSADLEVFPLEDGTRHEIIDGELYVTKQPDANHQLVSGRIWAALDDWSILTGAGEAYPAPGVLFAEDDDVAPDVAWASEARLPLILAADGHFHGAPELMVEVLSPGATNVRRDREVKFALYSRRGVDEYWIVDWRARTVDAYRRQGDVLEFVQTLSGDDVIESPLLPGFSARLARIFVGLRRE